jgi:hypothetical protein
MCYRCSVYRGGRKRWEQIGELVQRDIAAGPIRFDDPPRGNTDAAGGVALSRDSEVLDESGSTTTGGRSAANMRKIVRLVHKLTLVFYLHKLMLVEYG